MTFRDFDGRKIKSRAPLGGGWMNNGTRPLSHVLISILPMKIILKDRRVVIRDETKLEPTFLQPPISSESMRHMNLTLSRKPLVTCGRLLFLILL